MRLAQFWFHYAGGHWTSQRVSAPKGYGLLLLDLAQVPGAASKLAVGEADKNTANSSEGVIDHYTP